MRNTLGGGQQGLSMCWQGVHDSVQAFDNSQRCTPYTPRTHYMMRTIPWFVSNRHTDASETHIEVASHSARLQDASGVPSLIQTLTVPSTIDYCDHYVRGWHVCRTHMPSAATQASDTPYRASHIISPKANTCREV